MATTGTVRITQQREHEQQRVMMSPSPVDNIRLTPEQAEYLERQFNKTKNPHPSEMILIAAECGLSDDEVKIWFDYRMRLWRSDQGLNPVRSRLC